MTSNSETALIDQRQALQRKLLLQRLRINHLLAPQQAGDNSFPRSMTMRFLTQRPALAVRVLSEVGLLLLGPRLTRSLGTTMLLARILRAMASPR